MTSGDAGLGVVDFTGSQASDRRWAQCRLMLWGRHPAASPPKPRTPMTTSSDSPRRPVRRQILVDPVPVRPLITNNCELTPCPIVGYARSKTEAVRLLREAGWRVLRVGGLLELSDMGDDGDEWSVSVYPPREPLVWYDGTGRRTPYDVAAQAGRL